jgi:hypothetical protein
VRLRQASATRSEERPSRAYTVHTTDSSRGVRNLTLPVGFGLVLLSLGWLGPGIEAISSLRPETGNFVNETFSSLFLKTKNLYPVIERRRLDAQGFRCAI